MILNLSPDDVMDDGVRKCCGWPECERLADAKGYCDKHALRVKRGRALGCETSWDQLIFYAIAFVDAETDDEAEEAAKRMRSSAIEFARSHRTRTQQ